MVFSPVVSLIEGTVSAHKYVSTHSIFLTISGSFPFTKSKSLQVMDFRVKQNKTKRVKLSTYEYASA